MSPVLLTLVALVGGAAPSPQPLVLPGGEGGIGFDDLLYSRALDRVLVPGGRSGTLALVDPKTRKVESIGGFSSSQSFSGGHGEGTTSADAGDGFLFASDRNRKAIAIVDPQAKAIVGRVQLGGGPDYVRWVEATHELWVTEPGRKLIECFKFETTPSPRLVPKETVSVPGGPESLVVDGARGRAYTHTWKDETVVLDLRSHREVARWRNGCEGARGIALDEERGFLFVGCEEGKAVALDVAHDGKVLGVAAAGRGIDIIAYAPGLRHLYVPGGDSATMTVVSVGVNGSLSVLGTVPTAPDAHCVAADASGTVYVCDPKGGRLLLYVDTLGR
jgi:DNA-binding beta-propeller fold protein YncE